MHFEPEVENTTRISNPQPSHSKSPITSSTSLSIQPVTTNSRKGKEKASTKSKRGETVTLPEDSNEELDLQLLRIIRNYKELHLRILRYEVGFALRSPRSPYLTRNSFLVHIIRRVHAIGNSKWNPFSRFETQNNSISGQTGGLFCTCYVSLSHLFLPGYQLSWRSRSCWQNQTTMKQHGYHKLNTMNQRVILLERFYSILYL